MRHALKLHPDSRCEASTRIEVYAVRSGSGTLLLHYYLTGTGNIAIPGAGEHTRSDGLWRHTCFEAFLRSSKNAAYFEFNFSPSTAWAAYRFSGYRSEMSVVAGIAPQTELRYNAESFELRTRLKLNGLPDLPLDAPWQLGLSAVIEERSGRKSYWALAHPSGNADFHHSDCFALGLPTASPA